MEHYWEAYLLFGMAGILAVYLGAYFLLLWLGERKPRQARLTNADATYYLKGYDAKPNIRRA